VAGLVRHRGWRLLGSGLLIAAGLVAMRHAEGRVLGEGLLLAAAVWAGVGILGRAVAGLRRRDVTIELLVSVAAIGALVIGEVWEAAAVTWLFTLGAFLEARSLARTRRALGALLDLTPETATVLRDGRPTVVSPFEVEVGETVIVQPGGRIPVDGEVTEGAAAVDERSITGEPLPVDRGPGDTVFTGTVSHGFLQVRAQGVGADTTLARIVARVEEAQEAKAPRQRFIERFARVYTPAMLGASALVYGLTRDAHLALTLLVISCPGALVIAAPVASVAGIGRAAQRGVLLKGGDHLERLAHVTAVVFDKTGTLTAGRPALTEVIAFQPAAAVAAATSHGTKGASATDAGAEADLLRWAASAEMGSEHPLARPILEASARVAALPFPERFESFTGLGVRARVDGRTVVVGNAPLFAHLGLPLAAAGAEALASLGARGRTAVAVTVDGVTLGVLGIRDTLRPSAKAAVADLRALGVSRLAMLTGDVAATARAIAEETGLDEVRAGLLPEAKLAYVRDLQRAGEVVAMVGDGVNDAPALAAADVGVAMGAAGTRVALETAPVALMSDDLGKLGDALRLARATVRVSHQNLAIALVTVAALMTGVLLGEVHMAGGMLVHQASVLLVIANGLRLVRA
jgi:Zn2+/Cd2+-exporting ATPase